MSEQAITASGTLEKAPARDVSGQHRLGRNVAFAWGGYLVNIVAGFIMPRLISDRLGQSTLGIWDFCWSVVSYFGLVQLGLSGSVQRYVAKYRALGDTGALSRSVSTIGLSLKISGALAGVLSIAAAFWFVPLFGSRLGPQTDAARMIVLFLGLEASISILLTVYGGILVGCHRWDIHNFISALCYAVMTAGMIIALLAGGGLTSLAVIHCLSMSVGEVARWVMARRVCPEFEMNVRLANWEDWMEQARFSAKSMVPRIADLISNQSLALLITGFLGPAMLAVYSRPRGLMRQGQTIAAKFGSILIPTASSLQAQAEKSALRSTFLASSGFIASVTMPVVAVLVVFGDDLLRIWMGSAYVYKGLMAVLPIGCFPSLIQEPVWSILSGMNRHGSLAIWKLAAALCSAIALAIGMCFFHWKLLGAAIAFAVPQFLLDAAVAPTIACQLLDVSVARYYANAYLKPLPGALAAALCLKASFWAYRSAPWAAILLAALAAGVLGFVYLRAFSCLRSGVKVEA